MSGGAGAQPVAQPPADPDAARRHHRAPLRRRLRRRPAGRGEGTGQGAGLLVPRRVRPVGPEEPAARAVGALQRPAPRRRAHPGLPVVGLDRARHLAVHRAQEQLEIPSIYFSHRRPVFRRDGMLLALGAARRRRSRARSCSRPTVRYRTVGDMTCTGAVESTARPCVEIIEEVARRPGSPSAEPPGPTTGSSEAVHGGPQARGLLLAVELLRFATAGSVDDGKSTLIGRLLYDSKAIFEDQLEAVERVSRQRGDEYTDLALLTDGLRAEREQGITIDVAYRYFATPLRKFIIADTPGHIQYTRNMVTGNSTADLDPRPRRRPQGHRRADPPPRLPGLAVACPAPRCCASTRWTSSATTRRCSSAIREEFKAFATRLDVADLAFIPISALNGDNVVQRSPNMGVVRGPVPPAPSRAGLHRLRPQPDRPPHPGAVGGAPHGLHHPRLPRLRRPGGRRACSGPATRSRCSRRV